MLKQYELKRQLNYNQDTGFFTWKERVANCINIGDIAGHVRKDKRVLIRVNNKRYYSQL